MSHQYNYLPTANVFIFEMQVSSTPLAEFISLSSLNDNKMTDIKLLFASKYHISEDENR